MPTDRTGSAGGHWREYRAVKVDIHQTLVRAKHSPDLSEPEPGAIEALKHWQQQGIHIWLSCGGFRTGSDAEDYKAKVKRWLARHGVDPDQGIGFMPDQKYMADISDRAIQFKDWKSARAEADRRLAALEQHHDPDAS